MQTKAEWRRWSRSLPPATSAESAAVTSHVLGLIRSQGWTVVLTFLAMPGEVDLSLLRGEVELAVTRTPPKGPLTVHRLTDELETHRLGYRQPRAEAPSLDPAEIEAVLVPGLLFGRDGSRLGHGKGYYDRLLTGLHHRPGLIGITLERRLVNRLPMTETDVYMDAVVTEQGVTRASRISP